MNKPSIIYPTLFLLKKPVLGLCSKVIGSSEYLLITLSCSDTTIMNMQSRCFIITLWKEFYWGFITRPLFCNTLRELTLLTVLHFFTSVLRLNLRIMAYSPITLKKLLLLGLPVAFIESSRNFLILTFLFFLSATLNTLDHSILSNPVFSLLFLWHDTCPIFLSIFIVSVSFEGHSSPPIHWWNSSSLGCFQVLSHIKLYLFRSFQTYSCFNYESWLTNSSSRSRLLSELWALNWHLHFDISKYFNMLKTNSWSPLPANFLLVFLILLYHLSSCANQKHRHKLGYLLLCHPPYLINHQVLLIFISKYSSNPFISHRLYLLPSQHYHHPLLPALLQCSTH